MSYTKYMVCAIIIFVNKRFLYSEGVRSCMYRIEEDATYIRTTVARLFKYIKCVERSVDQDGEQESITLVQGAVLNHVNHHPGLSLKQLSQKLGLAHSTISGIVDRLEKKNMVERRTDENDKRFIRIYMTKNVESYLFHKRPMLLDAALAARMEQVGEEDREQIRAGLKALEKLFLQDHKSC